jgi:hypothetical protein
MEIERERKEGKENYKKGEIGEIEMEIYLTRGDGTRTR